MERIDQLRKIFRACTLALPPAWADLFEESFTVSKGGRTKGWKGETSDLVWEYIHFGTKKRGGRLDGEVQDLIEAEWRNWWDFVLTYRTFQFYPLDYPLSNLCPSPSLASWSCPPTKPPSWTAHSTRFFRREISNFHPPRFSIWCEGKKVGKTNSMGEMCSARTGIFGGGDFCTNRCLQGESKNTRHVILNFSSSTSDMTGIQNSREVQQGKNWMLA